MHFHAEHGPADFPLTGAPHGRRIACGVPGRAPGMNSCVMSTRGIKGAAMTEAKRQRVERGLGAAVMALVAMVGSTGQAIEG